MASWGNASSNGWGVQAGASGWGASTTNNNFSSAPSGFNNAPAGGQNQNQSSGFGFQSSQPAQQQPQQQYSNQRPAQAAQPAHHEAAAPSNQSRAAPQANRNPSVDYPVFRRTLNFDGSITEDYMTVEAYIQIAQRVPSFLPVAGVIGGSTQGHPTTQDVSSNAAAASSGAAAASAAPTAGAANLVPTKFGENPFASLAPTGGVSSLFTPQAIKPKVYEGSWGDANHMGSHATATQSGNRNLCADPMDSSPNDPGQVTGDGTRLKFWNVDSSVGKRDLTRFLEEHGFSSNDLYIPGSNFQPGQWNEGVIFVGFDSAETARNAIDQLANKVVNNKRTLKISYRPERRN